MMALDAMLSVILILAVLYIVVWIRGPHDGKIAIENRLLRHAKNYWRKRAER